MSSIKDILWIWGILLDQFKNLLRILDNYPISLRIPPTTESLGSITTRL